MGNGINFENHPHAISDVAEEVIAWETASTPPQTPDLTCDLNQLRPNQICVYRSKDAPALIINQLNQSITPIKSINPADSSDWGFEFDVLNCSLS
ncbi:hypothetical protein EDB81DRAFT_207492 [Dactylonectria macrodidyma]|uniref:Uncharacterized protein n=1 Tax=Dactylonectria macrodidyma TaxID=307937 RepID=A0A9P9DRH7_9HYPO|nr:hypothetical protein EDB81DRAFT_207492 [Dactylonectria macrodidyma]